MILCVNTKQSDVEASVMLELWKMQSTPSLLLYKQVCKSTHFSPGFGSIVPLLFFYKDGFGIK